MKKYLVLILSAIFLLYPFNYFLNTGKLIGTVCCQPSVLSELITKYGPIMSLVLGLVFLILFIILYLKECPKKLVELILYLAAFLAGLILIALFISRFFYSGLGNSLSLSFSKCRTIEATLTEKEAQGKTKEEIANEVAKLWFEANKSSDTCPRVRLEDYSINLIDGITNADDNGLITENGENIKFFISYSVKPTSLSQAEWVPGNGEEVSSGWIKDKNGFVMAVRDETGYKMTTLSTGP